MKLYLALQINHLSLNLRIFIQLWTQIKFLCVVELEYLTSFYHLKLILAFVCFLSPVISQSDDRDSINPNIFSAARLGFFFTLNNHRSWPFLILLMLIFAA